MIILEVQKKLTMSPKISVIVPIYNVEKYLERCIQSILNQTLNDIEIILVNDGSPDNSSVICDAYAKKYRNIKVIHKKNQGLGYARNSGLDIASGEFVAFVDSDDTIHPDMYSHMYNMAINYGLDATYCGIVRIPDNKTLVPFVETEENLFFQNENVQNEFLINMIGSPPYYTSDVMYQMSSCRAIYSNNIIKMNNIRFLSERDILSEDIVFNIDFLTKSTKVLLMPNGYYYYWRNEGSLSTTYSRNKIEKANLLYKLIEIKLKSIGLLSKGKNNIDRMYLCIIRIFIANEIIYNKNRKERNDNLLHLYNQDILINIKERYPYWNLPIKHRIFFFFLKFNLIKLNNMILKLANHAK